MWLRVKARPRFEILTPGTRDFPHVKRFRLRGAVEIVEQRGDIAAVGAHDVGEFRAQLNCEPKAADPHILHPPAGDTPDHFASSSEVWTRSPVQDSILKSAPSKWLA